MMKANKQARELVAPMLKSLSKSFFALMIEYHLILCNEELV